MENFKVQFSVSPWLLLLIIPFLALTFFLYFRMEKRYRKSKNRILSMILHTIVSVLCVILLSGMFFSWETPNVENELCILVDASYSEQQAGSRVNSFVKEILDSNNGRSNIAIVTFGFDQKIALEMDDHNPEKAYQTYLDAEKPDTSATDIAAALKFVYDPATGKSGGESGKTIFEYPESARILLISDGLETDEDALGVAKRISMEGIHIDTSFFPSSSVAPDVWITSVTQPDRKFSLGDPFEYSLDLRSNFEGSVSLALYDNDALVYEKPDTPLSLGEQTVLIPHSFTTPGHHELRFTISGEGDSLTNNNVYYSYYDLEEHSKLLIIEKYADESEEIVDILRQNNSDEDLAIEVVQIGDRDKLPSSLEMMQEYDEIVLDNIAYSDMPEGFEENLNKYVNECGGGLFTVGGVERDPRGQVIMTGGENSVPLAHSYQKTDMDSSKYFKRMLPVEAADFTPPVALVIIIDCSGSMAFESGGLSLIDYAVTGAVGCLDVLSPRDYVGVMLMEDSYKVGLDMTPMSQKKKIITAIRRIADGGGGGTYYASAIEHAGRALSTVDVERKHILLISDGQPGDTLNKSDEFAGYGNVMQRYHDNDGVTISVVSIGTPISADLRRLAQIGEGSAFMLSTREMDQMKVYLSSDLFVTDISGAVPQNYHPSISNRTPILENITQSSLNEITMNGFFATRAKSTGNAVVTLMADSVPLYAQWSYGSGKVGSFMCDLNGYWSQEFLDSEEIGEKIVNNIIKGLIPTIDIRAHTLEASFLEDNYHTQVSVFGYTQKEEPNSKLVAFIEPPGSAEPQKYDLSELSVSGNRFTFLNREPGIHRVTILKVPGRFNIDNAAYQSPEDIPNAQIQAVLQTYRAFSYSEEYDPTADAYSTGKDLLIKMSSREVESGNAEEKLIEDPDEFMSVFMNVYKTWDPRLWILSITIVLFLIDVAIRKFKFRKLQELFGRKKRKTQ